MVGLSFEDLVGGGGSSRALPLAINMTRKSQFIPERVVHGNR